MCVDNVYVYIMYKVASMKSIKTPYGSCGLNKFFHYLLEETNQSFDVTKTSQSSNDKGCLHRDRYCNVRNRTVFNIDTYLFMKSNKVDKSQRYRCDMVE
jgi:hypothetical protein